MLCASVVICSSLSRLPFFSVINRSPSCCLCLCAPCRFFFFSLRVFFSLSLSFLFGSFKSFRFLSLCVSLLLFLLFSSFFLLCFLCFLSISYSECTFSRSISSFSAIPCIAVYPFHYVCSSFLPLSALFFSFSIITGLPSQFSLSFLHSFSLCFLSILYPLPYIVCNILLISSTI